MPFLKKYMAFNYVGVFLLVYSLVHLQGYSQIEQGDQYSLLFNDLSKPSFVRILTADVL